MYTFEEQYQMNFNDQFFIPGSDPVPDDHKYVRMVKAIRWENLFRQMRQFYSHQGRPSKAVKIQIILLMVKHMEQLSDELLLGKFRDNLPLQKACNIPYLQAQTYIKDASLFCKFRGRIGIKGCEFIDEVVEAFIKEKKLVKDRTVIVDTTVVESDIAYPTDINLLEKSRQALLGIIKDFGCGVKFRTYSRTARKTFLQYIKLGRRKRTVTKKVHGKMLRFTRRNLEQARQTIETVKKGGERGSEVEKAEKLLQTIGTLLNQQREIHGSTRRNGSKQGIRIKDRIVSIFKPYVRPISRGKIPVPVEFGPKILLEMRSGFIRLLKTSFDNNADSDMLSDMFERWKNLILGGDRGFHSPKNTRLAIVAGVKRYFVEKKGKRSHPKNSSLKRVRGKRATIEAKISLAKRKYGLKRILYGREEEGEKQWICLGITAMNFDRALRICNA